MSRQLRDIMIVRAASCIFRLSLSLPLDEFNRLRRLRDRCIETVIITHVCKMRAYTFPLCDVDRKAGSHFHPLITCMHIIYRDAISFLEFAPENFYLFFFPHPHIPSTFNEPIV